MGTLASCGVIEQLCEKLECCWKRGLVVDEADMLGLVALELFTPLKRERPGRGCINST